jgi:hypothetical protein
MTELKTLKDFDDWNQHEGPQGNKWETRKTPEQLKEELKQEAIKRLKEAQSEGNAINNTTWALFFNITEEELGECKHDWGNILLMSNPPQRRCIKCGKTEFLNNLCSSTSGDFK